MAVSRIRAVAGRAGGTVIKRLLMFGLVVTVATAAFGRGASEYAALRTELRAFYPSGYCRNACQSKEQIASCAEIGRELDAWAAAHPGFDALDVRRESYLAMRRHFVPFLFTNSPFYFEAGVNGGWSGARPARHVNRICSRFYREQGLVPQAAFDLLANRQRANLTLCCGPFVDDMHHVPPLRTILEKGFKGVRDEVAAALANCPKDDPLGRKELETALVGLDTIHALQLKFAEEAERRLKSVGEGEERTRLLRISEAARCCPWEPPQTFFEGMNTFRGVEHALVRARDPRLRRWRQPLLARAAGRLAHRPLSTKVFPHPVYTMCLKGGVESRRDTTDGGITGKQRPREITLGFVGNVVDSLCAIDQVCFRDKVCSVRTFLDAVRANWKGEQNEHLRLLAMAAPYWGDNSDRSTSLMAWFIKKTAEDVDGLTNDLGGFYRLAIFTYREFMYWGLQTKATPDGRRDGDYLAQGFSPSEFRCKEGATTVMNAIGRLPNECLYECNANLTFDASAMTPELMGAVLRVFAEKGSHLMQPNCNSVEQLLDAQKHPERHQDLIVRVCGFSARFISLSKRWQDEVIARHRLK